MLEYGSVSTKPVKRFFVDMLTRDIDVDEAILDLLDNCVDGILRSADGSLNAETPYVGYWAKIKVGGNSFEIEDNCGGIPWSEHERAFRMGRPLSSDSSSGEIHRSVGVYGIGMKRAIFKMGSRAMISTQNGQNNYRIEIPENWMADEDNWDLEVVPEDTEKGNDGTLIMIKSLHPEVADLFSAEKFGDNLLNKIQSHYSIIIQKGFKVEVNGVEARSKPFRLRFAEEASRSLPSVQPYIFKADVDDVEIFLVVGLREPIPSMEDTLEEQEYVRASSHEAGWSVICNDRVVLYCNRDELTGWGTGGVPRYHTQFIAISGIVEFRGPPLKLPTTTTKRGLNFSSGMYQQVLDRMREGIRLFIDFTNRWKSQEAVAKALVSPAPALQYSELRKRAENMEFSTLRSGLRGAQYRPSLPLPPNDSTDIRISYIREREQVYALAEVLLEDFQDLKSREKELKRKVGERSFDYSYKSLVNDDSVK